MRPLILSLGLLLALPLPAAESAAQQMRVFSAGLHSLSADFSQRVVDAGGRVGDESRGSLALEAPRQFRWQTDSPYRQLIVADGSRVWVYEPELEQVSVRSQGSAEAQSPLTVLTDLSQLDAQFTTADAGSHDGLAWLKLSPRAAEPQFEFAELGFAADQLRRMRFRDQLGNSTEIEFSDWRRNPQLPTDSFRFTPPDGVDVVGDLKPAAELHPLEN